METSPPGVKAPTYTHGSYWGGAQLPFWVFLLFTAFPLTGFFGIDHLLFRSPSTAFTKGITNIFTLGLWYFYDIIQAFSDKDFIESYGFSKPAVGPAGLALDYFSNITSKEVKKNQNGGGDKIETEKQSGAFGVLVFIAYIFSLFMPFGISNFVAGDNMGGVVKLLLSLIFIWGIIFWIPYFFMGSFFELYRALFSTETLFEKGVLRIPPLSLIMAPDGLAPNLMNPKALEAEAKKKADDTFYNNWIKPILSFIPFADVLDTTKCAVVPPAKQTIEAAQQASEGVIGLAKTVPEVASKATGQLTAFTDPEKLKALAIDKTMSGGAIGLGKEGAFDWVIVAGLGILVFGGLGASALRKYFSNEQNDEPSGKANTNDAPPNPRGI